jgi:hypothetical protein
MGTWIAVIVATAALLGVAALRSARRRRRRLSTMDAARTAAKGLARESRTRRGMRSRGEGSPYTRTRLDKYGDERHEPSGGFDGGGGGSD